MCAGANLARDVVRKIPDHGEGSPPQLRQLGVVQLEDVRHHRVQGRHAVAKELISVGGRQKQTAAENGTNASGISANVSVSVGSASVSSSSSGKRHHHRQHQHHKQTRVHRERIEERGQMTNRKNREPPLDGGGKRSQPSSRTTQQELESSCSS